MPFSCSVFFLSCESIGAVADADSKHAAEHERDISQEEGKRIKSPGIEGLFMKEFLLVWADP